MLKVAPRQNVTLDNYLFHELYILPPYSMVFLAENHRPVCATCPLWSVYWPWQLLGFLILLTKITLIFFRVTCHSLIKPNLILGTIRSVLPTVTPFFEKSFMYFDGKKE